MNHPEPRAWGPPSALFANRINHQGENVQKVYLYTHEVPVSIESIDPEARSDGDLFTVIRVI